MAATRAAWAAHLRERYTPRVVEFIDTGVGQQKQACVAVLRPTAAAGLPVAKPLVLVLWRGSKAATDYLRTDTTQSFDSLDSYYQSKLRILERRLRAAGLKTPDACMVLRTEVRRLSQLVKLPIDDRDVDHLGESPARTHAPPRPAPEAEAVLQRP